MERSQVHELHFMTPVENLPSILEVGILSYSGASGRQHVSVALDAVQERRATRAIPGGMPLHDYANLYFHARNAMMWMRRSRDLVVVRIRPDVLDLPGVVISDGNAANGSTRFLASPHGLGELDADRVFAEWWTHEDYWVQQELKRQRQAEVLVPNVVVPELLLGCYTRVDSVAADCQTLAEHWDVEVKPYIYFD